MSKYERYIDRFFDENNFDNITLEDNNGKSIEFEQIAIVDYEESYYAILKPVSKIDNVEEDEVLVFRIDEEKDELAYVDDEALAEKVFDICMNYDEE
jgi:uncharacterized protein YrzB (UPF0473 family)